MNAQLREFARQLLRPVIITVAAGVALVSLPLVSALSFDLAFLDPFRPSPTLTNVMVVVANENTVLALSDGRGRIGWDHHARLLDRLTSDGARLVFYDFIFAETNPVPELNDRLARAIQRQGNVVLVAAAAGSEEPGIHIEQIARLPVSIDGAARASGHGELIGNVVRTLPRDYAGEHGAAWAAAALLNPDRLGGQNPSHERWLNYYGSPPSGGLPVLNFDNALSATTLTSNLFAGKIVFVGQTAPAEGARNRKDTFATPYTRFGQKPMPGVTVHATALLNLVRDDWLRAIPLAWQWVAAGIWGSVSTALLFSLCRRPKLVLVMAAMVGAAALCAVSLCVQWRYHWWWSWAGPVLGQTLIAFLFAFGRRPGPDDPYIAFVSFHTDDDGETAQRIADGLTRKGRKTFISTSNLDAGAFDEQLLKRIEESTFFILVLSPNSLRRCTESGDWVIRELTHALTHGKRIIPILKGGLNFKAHEKEFNALPQLQQLTKFEAIDYSLKELKGFLRRLIKLMKLSG
jgi:CHASE2 domain-containing sensor protein